MASDHIFNNLPEEYMIPPEDVNKPITAIVWSAEGLLRIKLMAVPIKTKIEIMVIIKYTILSTLKRPTSSLIAETVSVKFLLI